MELVILTVAPNHDVKVNPWRDEFPQNDFARNGSHQEEFRPLDFFYASRRRTTEIDGGRGCFHWPPNRT